MTKKKVSSFKRSFTGNSGWSISVDSKEAFKKNIDAIRHMSETFNRAVSSPQGSFKLDSFNRRKDK